jgi:DNA-binding LacI/PurR family transcriptional regulator
MKHKTLIDIAKIAGVSPSTVSRALRNHPDINLKTIERIKKIAEKYNFSPNPIAQGLKNNTTRTIGVIVPEITHDFFSTAISGIEKVVYNSGYTLILCQSNEEYEREVINIDMLLNHRVAGIIVSISENTKNGDHFKRVIERKTPLVFFDRVYDEINTTKVIIDDRKGAVDAVSFLIQKGYKKIAHFAGPKNLSNSSQRYQGYCEALKKNKVKINKDFVFYGGMNEDDGYVSMEKVLNMKNRPDAIFAVNDPVAIGAFQKITEAGLKIPKDIALIGFSNNKIMSLVKPALTTVEQPSFEMGKKSAELIISRIENGKGAKNETIVLDTRLIIRDSA